MKLRQRADFHNFFFFGRGNSRKSDSAEIFIPYLKKNIVENMQRKRERKKCIYLEKNKTQSRESNKRYMISRNSCEESLN